MAAGARARMGTIRHVDMGCRRHDHPTEQCPHGGALKGRRTQVLPGNCQVSLGSIPDRQPRVLDIAGNDVDGTPPSSPHGGQSVEATQVEVLRRTDSHRMARQLLDPCRVDPRAAGRRVDETGDSDRAKIRRLRRVLVYRPNNAPSSIPAASSQTRSLLSEAAEIAATRPIL